MDGRYVSERRPIRAEGTFRPPLSHSKLMEDPLSLSKHRLGVRGHLEAVSCVIDGNCIVWSAFFLFFFL